MKQNMAILNDNLTSKEKHADFSTSEADNDTFSIEQTGGKYPGAVPDYNPDVFLNSMTENRVEIDLSNNEPQNTEIENIGNEANIQQETADDFREITGINDNNDSNENIDINDSIESGSIDNVDTDSVDDILNMEQDNIVSETEQSNSVAEAEPQPEVNEFFQDIEQTDQPIVFDDDFLELLKDDIKKEPVKSKLIEEEKQAIEEVIQYGDLDIDTSQGDEELNADLVSMEIETKLKDKGPIDNIENILSEFDVSSPPIEVPKQTQVENIVNKNTINTDNKTNTAYISDKNNMTSEKEKQNNKKTFALIVTIVCVAMILVVGGVIGYLYLSSKQNIPYEPKITEQKDTTKHNKQVVEHKTDTSKVDSNNVDSSRADTTKIDITTSAMISTKESPVAKSKTVDKPKNTNINRVKVNPVAKSKPEKTQLTLEEKGHLYTIQIYSSPIKSDAEKRLSILSKKGISGYITQQDIKGHIWYRVRFGNYEKYEEAVYIVKKLSLKDAWIERIK
jgi:cell division septation protein DedD